MSQGAVGHIRRTIADRIVTGDLLPGARLEEVELAAGFGVSRTPVREALRDLAAAGLIEVRPRRGAVVATVDADGIAQLFEAVGHLEGLVARLAAQRMTTLERKRLEQLQIACGDAARAADREAYVRHNQDFHLWIARGARNQPVLDMVESLRLRLQPYRNAAFRAAGAAPRGDRMISSLGEHDVLIAAILAEDAETAERAMRDHVATSAVGVLDFYLHAREPMPALSRGAA